MPIRVWAKIDWWRLIRIVSSINTLSERGRTEDAKSLRDTLRRNSGLENIVASAQAGGSVKIAYIPNSPIPTLNANCVHAMKLCDAIGGRGRDVIIVSSKPESPQWKDKDDALEFFSVRDLNLLLFESSGNAKRDDLKKIQIALENGATHCLSRSSVAAYFAALAGLPTVLDIHLPLRTDVAAIVKDLFRQPSFRGLTTTTIALRDLVQRELQDTHTSFYVVPNAASSPQTMETDFGLTPIEDTALQVGYSGHLYPGKGLEIVLELAKRLPNVGFHILGGRDRDIQSWQTKLTGLRNVRFYGFRPQSEVNAFLDNIDVALAPYMRQVTFNGGSKHEQSLISSLKLFEYMAHGLPIVASDLPSIREVLTHGENALLCDPDNLEGWVRAIEQLKRDEELRSRLARNARADFDANYTWDIRASRLLSILET